MEYSTLQGVSSKIQYQKSIVTNQSITINWYKKYYYENQLTYIWDILYT
jgi:hypothetical protein